MRAGCWALSRRARVGLISALGNETDSRDIRPKPNSRLCISSLQPLELQDQAEHTLHRGEEGQSGRAIKINQSTRHFRVVFSERNTWHSVVAHAPTRTLTNTLLIPGPVNMTNDIVRLPTRKQLTHGPRCLPLSSFRQPTPSYSHCLVKNLPFFNFSQTRIYNVYYSLQYCTQRIMHLICFSKTMIT